MSLIDTALKSTSDGTVRLHASAIDLNDAWRLRFDVTDTGSGYARAEREQLFKPMLKVPTATAAERRATGLELAIGRKLAALMGGEVGCDSAVGKGSLYWFTLTAEHAGQEPFVTERLEAEPPFSCCSRMRRSRQSPGRKRSPKASSGVTCWWSRTTRSTAC